MPDDRLTSWKEIAVYLQTTTRTVMRWEDAGLPVHRLQTGKRATVFAFQSEIDAWLANRSQQPSEAAESPPAIEPAPQRRRPTRTWPLAAAAATFAILGLSASLSRHGGLLPAGDREILLDPPGVERTPAISPDGSMVAYARLRPDAPDYDIYILDVYSGENRAYASGPTHELAPAWSPDGESLLYLREKSGSRGMAESEVVLAEADAETDHKWTAGRVVATLSLPERDYVEPMLLGPYFTWEADGRHVILPAGAPGERGLIRMDLETGERSTLTRTGDATVEDVAPALSPDGRWLAFARRYQSDWSELFVMDANLPGSAPRQLTSLGQVVMTPRFADDGESILVSIGGVGAGRTIWRVDPSARSEPVRAAEPGRSFYGFDTAPNGRALVVTSGRIRSSIWGLDVANATAEPVRLTDSAGLNRRPALSPDGKRLAYFSDLGAASEIWIADASGSSARRLTSGAGEPEASLDWSPDGASLVTTLRRGEARSVFVVDAETGELRRVTEGGFQDGHARWGPKGEWIYFGSDRVEGSRSLYRVRASGGEPERLGEGLAMDFADRGRTTLVSPERQNLSSLVDGQLRRLADITAPRSFAPSTAGFVYLRPGERGTASLEYHGLRGDSRTLQELVARPAGGISSNATGSFVAWSQTEPPESDLVVLRLR